MLVSGIAFALLITNRHKDQSLRHCKTNTDHPYKPLRLAAQVSRATTTVNPIVPSLCSGLYTRICIAPQDGNDP